MKRFLPAAATALLALLFCAPQQSLAEEAAPPGKHYTVKRATGAISVDGHISERDWKECETIVLGERHGEQVRQETVCRMLWDDDFLYISWDCEDSQVWSTMTTRDDTLWQQEVVEVFINPDGDRGDYLELEVNPLGALWDGYILKREDRLIGILAWNSNLIRWGVAIDGTVNDPSDRDGGWSVELAVPLVEMVSAANRPPEPGDRWRANLYRIDLPGRSKENGEYSLWCPVSGRSFHDPDSFGEIIFSGDRVR